MKKSNLLAVMFMSLGLSLLTSVVFAEDALIVDQDGNVGIGTSSPETTLDVNGDVNASGQITSQSQPSFAAHPSEADYIVVGSNTMLFQTEKFDQGDDFSSGTTFTASVTGKYLFTYFLRFGNIDTAANYDTYLATSNRNWQGPVFEPSNYMSSDGYWYASFSIVCDMDAGDTAPVRVTQTGGTQQAYITTGSHFSGALLF